jgi:trigger factor
MPYTVNKTDQKATFTITVDKETVLDAMQDAAKRISEQTKIPGFRPGKADYETVKKRVGEMKILEEATEGLIRTAFVKAMLDENLDTVGQPYFNVEKIAPGNELVFTAEISLFPAITKLADYTSLSITPEPTKASPEDIKRAKKDLTLMQTKETRAEKDHVIKKGDKAVVALGMKKDGVTVEGGESQNHGIYTAEEHYVPGFVDEITGLKEGDKKTFTLAFPKEHYQKHMAGEDIVFDVEVKEIFKLEAPEINDEFAKSLGLKSAKELEEKLVENLESENKVRENMRQEKEALELIAEKSTFEKIPDLLANQEIEKMLHELKHTISQKGIEFDEYLKQINKSLAQIKLDFTPNAITRIKVALILKEVSAKENIQVQEKELDAELDRLAEQYQDEETKKRVFEPQFRDYIEHQMRNRKTIDLLKGKMVKK